MSEFGLRLTPKAGLLGLGLLLVAAYVGRIGWLALHQFNPQDPARLVFALPPLILAGSILLLMVSAPLSMCRGRVVVDGAGVHYHEGAGGAPKQSFAWADLLTSSSPAERWWFRRLILIHRAPERGPAQLVLYDLFVPEFDALSSTLALHRHRYAHAREAVVQLD